MSRIRIQSINIPEKTEVTLTDGVVSVKGPLGNILRKVKPDVAIEIKNRQIILAPQNTTRFAKALWGTYASHMNNMVKGVNEAFVKKLIVEGVGYRVEVEANKVILNVGYSHPVKVSIPEGIEVVTQKNTLTIKGIDKEVVGEFAANVRAVRKPEPYKGKGIRYEDEIVRRKQGKKVV